ncbi:M1 family metallopeptidase [Crocinitomicaceae bacterium]|nr:M1 family metallopeptidase [Crocinitomicaceae bacterium]
MKYSPIKLLILLALLQSCALISSDSNKNTVTNLIQEDAHTYSNCDEVHTVHLHLDLNVDFSNKTIYGVARHQINRISNDTAIFDIKELDIQKVTLGSNQEKPTTYDIGTNDVLLGQALSVKIDTNTTQVNIYYQTTNHSEALDWLNPELTVGGKYPFMYTQGQAILTRSWIPIQDTPMNRITYSADISVPPGLLAIMSAENPTLKNDTGLYHFEMKQQIPSYLIALAVGDMQYTSLGPNCGVYSEPELAEACQYEFTDLSKMMYAAEQIYGEYRWEQYDLALLPYSFPFGGMENPRLTFANPTLIAGDRSLTSVIAHELAHSWSGNLVTNATWNDFWLNEGFTVYFENRIMEALYGREHADILALIEFQDLEAELERMKSSEHPEDTKLKLNLDNRNPDDGMTDIAYIKGAFFLRTLEAKVGRKRFDAFIKEYFDTHAFQTITTEEFIVYLNDHLLKPHNINFNTAEWIYETGLPRNCIQIDSDRLNQMIAFANLINSGETIFTGKHEHLKRGDFISQEWQTFIRSLEPSISHKLMNEIDAQLKFSTEGNPALQSDWFRISVESGNKSMRPAAEKYLNKIGRRWYIEGIYKACRDSNDPDHLEWAKKVFNSAQHNYHFVSKNTIQEILFD